MIPISMSHCLLGTYEYITSISTMERLGIYTDNHENNYKLLTKHFKNLNKMMNW
jgi:hypothetical protein